MLSKKWVMSVVVFVAPFVPTISGETLGFLSAATSNCEHTGLAIDRIFGNDLAAGPASLDDGLLLDDPPELPPSTIELSLGAETPLSIWGASAPDASSRASVILLLCAAQIPVVCGVGFSLRRTSVRL